ncbi:MAG: HAMP domain-containing sensor histidine kinase [Bacteroidales bacterium]
MKEWRLRLLIVFSLFSIAGLMAIQAYWIYDAIRIKENHFRQTVNQAVTGAVLRIEQNALLSEKERYHKSGGSSPGNTILSDTSRVLVPEPQAEQPVDNGAAASRNLQDNYQEIIAQILDTSLLIKDSDPGSLPPDPANDGWTERQGPLPAALENDSIIAMISRRLDQQTDFTRTRSHLEDLMEGFAEQRMDTPPDRFLDSAEIAAVIREELERSGLKLDFVFGVYFPFTSDLFFCDTVLYQQLLLESGFVFNLFPNFNLSKPAYLILYFPDEKHYLFSRLGWVLILSVFLTLVLIWSFYFITRSIYRQKKLGEMKNDFINNMTHEFKTPVSTISLACEALRDQDIDKSPSAVENYLKIIDEENRRLGKLAEQILQTAVIDKGHLYLYFETVSIHQLVGQIIEKYQHAVQQQSGVITTKLLAADPAIRGDRSHLYNMVSNLVDNAIKYSGNRLEIEILTRDTRDSVTISIQDKGVGISKANQKRIFEKLYRVPTGNVHNVKGFGLGLSYVKYIVERHEGTIRVESEPNKGSTFVITMPRQPLNRQ